MIKVELSYNPYIMETIIKFNGRPPKINSLVEKYQGTRLQGWMNKIPSIFYNEMNGYDFELEFSGTNHDYEELKNTFVDAGVSEDEVKLFHKNELDSRAVKTTQIRNLLQWFDTTPNRKFAVETFRNEYTDLYEHSYPFILVKGSGIDTTALDGMDVSMEMVDSTKELENTELTNTPVLFYLDENTQPSFQNNMITILKRPDVSGKQLFFLVHPILPIEKVQRTIKDLGILYPQMVHAINDVQITRYLEIYSVSDYIYSSIQSLRGKYLQILTMLQKENEQSKIKNQDVHNKIQELEDVLERLKVSYNLFVQKDNLEFPVAFQEARIKLRSRINGWKIRKVKITKYEEAEKLSKEFDEAIHKYYDEFIDEIFTIMLDIKSHIDEKFRSWYDIASFDLGYESVEIPLEDGTILEIPSISSKLMTLKEEKYVVPKEDFWGKLLKTSSNENVEAILETTYFYQAWREHATTVVEEIIQEIQDNQFCLLKEYFEESAKAYEKHLEQLIHQQTQEKNTVSSQLSEEEQQLQMDNDWLVAFDDQLKVIERG